MSLEDLKNLTVPELLERAARMEKDSTLYQTLLNDPATRGETLALVKKKYPQTSIPELDAKAAADAAIAAERAEREKLEAKVRDLEFDRRLEAQRESVVKKYDLTDADLLAVEALMTDKDAPIPHYDSAVKVHMASKKSAEPTSSHIARGPYEMPSKDKWGPGVGNKMALNKIFQTEAYAALDALHGRKSA